MIAHAVFITHRAKPGRRADAEHVWNRVLRPAIEANPDHLTYVYTFDGDDSDVIRAFQLYRTAEAAAAFLHRPEYLEYVQAVEAHLEGPPVVATATARWNKS